MACEDSRPRQVPRPRKVVLEEQMKGLRGETKTEREKRLREWGTRLESAEVRSEIHILIGNNQLNTWLQVSKLFYSFS